MNLYNKCLNNYIKKYCYLWGIESWHKEGGFENSMTEQQIREEILRYLKDKAYNYAVLIDGEWGSGKTYFVNNTLTKAIVKQEEASGTPRMLKYISLYGCKSMLDVQENIAWSFAENAREKIKNKADWGATEEKVSGNLLLSSKKIGNAILKKFLPEASLYEIAYDWLNLGSFIFVFDDLERCDCPINEVFGFLNELVEHENTKVIIIANEKELSGAADTQYLELQYLLSLDGRVEWPKQDEHNLLADPNRNSQCTSINEMERRRELLFPPKADNNYCKIREKLIGVTLKYEPNVLFTISEIVEASNYGISIKGMLRKQQETFVSTMEYYHHSNLRTFQFFLSKVSYLLEKLSGIEIIDQYHEPISSQIISEAFSHAVRFKSNYQPPRDNYPWLRTEQETKFQSIKRYIEFGTYDHKSYRQDVLNLQNELQSQISNDDPYFLVYQQYYFHTQSWCEEQLEKILQQLNANKYPISFYGKILVEIQRMLDLGFDSEYMNRAKKLMLDNISNMGEVNAIDPDIWYVEDQHFKERVAAVVIDINDAIKNHTETVSRENVVDMLKHEDWSDRLQNYINPNKLPFIQDIIVFSKAPSEQWLTVLHNASPKDIADFCNLLHFLYPRNVKRNSYYEEKDTIKDILTGLKKLEEDDLIKKEVIRWLGDQFEAIVEYHEPQQKREIQKEIE